MIIDHLRSLRIVLEDLYAVVNGENEDGSSQLSSTLNMLDRQDGPLVQCKTELLALEKMLETGSKWKNALIWPIKETDVKKTLDNLERINTTLIITLNADQR
jgi:hypothetical protein